MSDTTPTATHSPDSANLKRKVVAIVGLWGVVGAIVFLSPSNAPTALMAGVAASSIIGAE